METITCATACATSGAAYSWAAGLNRTNCALVQKTECTISEFCFIGIDRNGTPKTGMVGANYGAVACAPLSGSTAAYTIHAGAVFYVIPFAFSYTV